MFRNRKKLVVASSLTVGILLILAMAFLLTQEATAEYYKYVDRNGTVIFVDDLSKIPKEYRTRKQTYKEKYDDLSDEDRAAMLARDRQEAEERKSREAELRKQEKFLKEQEELQKRQVTKVIIHGNQVYVPVTVANGNSRADAFLLLDTGASTTLISPELAARLNIEQTETTRVGVAGAKVLKAKRTALTEVTVGPHTKNNVDIVILRHVGGDGLLGMNFLRGLKYDIDFEAQVINWIP